jgi:hypothetical protein
MGWSAILDAARPCDRLMQSAAAAPERQQSEFLLAVVTRNADTAFGREHGFDTIRCMQDFQHKVPVRPYEDFAPWISRIAEGERAVLTRDPVIAFEETGGSSSGLKLIPYTQASLDAFRAAILPWLLDLSRRRPGVLVGRAYVAASPAARQLRRTPCGLAIGLASEAAYLGDDLAGCLGEILVTRPGTAACTSLAEWKIKAAADLVAARDLTLVSIWSPTFFDRLLRTIDHQTDQVMAALHDDPHSRRRLTEALVGDGLDTQRLWPDLDTISCWADGPSRREAETLVRQFPNVFLEPKGIVATESPITIPNGSASGAIPALLGAFIEFIDERGVPIAINDVQEGASYRVVLTTPGGLYRYDIGDVVRCVGMGQLPRLTFVGRSGLVSDLVGEKLTDAFAAVALAKLSCPAMLMAQTTPHPHYEVWLDGPVEQLDIVETALRHNPQYRYARDIGQLGPLVSKSSPGFVRKEQELLAARGARLGSLKASSLRAAALGKPAVSTSAATNTDANVGTLL